MERFVEYFNLNLVPMGITSLNQIDKMYTERANKSLYFKASFTDI